jgi:hypothetical protein
VEKAIEAENHMWYQIPCANDTLKEGLSSSCIDTDAYICRRFQVYSDLVCTQNYISTVYIKIKRCCDFVGMNMNSLIKIIERAIEAENHRWYLPSPCTNETTRREISISITLIY